MASVTTSGPQAVGISLWLVPDAETRGRLAGLIDALAARHGTPPFEPHVTLLAGSTDPEADVLAGARDLATALPRLAIRFTGVADFEEFFRCVVLCAAEDAALMAAAARARERLVPADRSPYRPHLSLVYGSLEAPARARIRARIGDDWPRTVTAVRLEAVRTEGPPASWRSLRRWPLSAPAPR